MNITEADLFVLSDADLFAIAVHQTIVMGLLDVAKAEGFPPHMDITREEYDAAQEKMSMIEAEAARRGLP